MPIGASKVGALGGLVPGGSVTFNASGTWDVPPGVKVVSITGKGGTGNPGVAGNPGNPGNPGTGGTGGDSGYKGGVAWNPGPITEINTQVTFCSPVNNDLMPVNNNPANIQARARVNPSQPGAGQAGTQGASGNAGTAGQAGTAGNTGQTSSALTKCFPGGAGGNAPPGGAAGNAGTGGQGGGGAGRYNPNQNPSTTINGGVGGNGGGTGSQLLYSPSPPVLQWSANSGGGGAGVANDGKPASNIPQTFNLGLPNVSPRAYSSGGDDPSVVGFPPVMYGPSSPGYFQPSYTNLNRQPFAGPACGANPCMFSLNVTGGYGRGCPGTGSGPVIGSLKTNFLAISQGAFNFPGLYNFPQGGQVWGPRFYNNCQVGPTSNLWRAGGGGASGQGGQTFSLRFAGAGGGGRGNAGNAGGNSPTVSGQAATPVTFNCVPVTPGTPTPITVGAPGGQIVISWNPQ